MFQKTISWIIGLLFDQRGENDPAAGAGDGSGAGDGQGDQGGAESGAQGGDSGAGPATGITEGDAGASQEGVVTPKFGEFGDDPIKLFQGYQGLKSKTTATERNLATLRKNLENVGLKIGEDGTIQLGEKDGSAPKTKRFTADHAKLFDAPVLQAMQGLIEDLFEDRLGKYEQKNTMKQQYMTMKETSNSKMTGMFPQLLKEVDGEVNPQFNQAFYDRATEIWSTTPGYKSHPSGELYSTMEAAIEMGISPIAIAKAKAAGYKAGVNTKKVLGPTSGVGAGAQGATGFKRLSVAEFRLLTPDKKEEYQQQLIKQSK